MDFSWTKEQTDFYNEVVAFAQSDLQDDLMTRDRDQVFSRDLWQRCADFGVQGLAAPAEYGGKFGEIDILTSMFAMVGLGYGCKDNGLTFGLNAHMWTVQLPIVQFGTTVQKKKYLPPLVDGRWIAAHALTEKASGSDAYGLKTTAQHRDGGYVLNGSKTMVTFAPIADVALVFANAQPDRGKWGLAAFLVETGTEGYTVSESQEKMGLRTVPIGDMMFQDCWVPEENRLGAEGAGFSLSNHSLEYERCSILASHLGTMERQLEEAVAYVAKQERFGQPIGKFQSVSNRVADMKLRLETARLLLYKTAWLKHTGKSAMMESALLKLHLSECFVDSSLDAIRSYGGKGYMTETGVERDARDAIGGLLYAGTSDIQRNIIAGLLGL